MASQYDVLVADYIQELSNAKAEVLEWWDSLYKNLPDHTEEEEAEQLIRRRWPAGPASHPRIIAIFRKYFFAIELLNNQSVNQDLEEDSLFDDETQWGEQEETNPHEDEYYSPLPLLLDQLETRAPELAAFMQSFIYIPIGIDPDGEEC